MAEYKNIQIVGEPNAVAKVTLTNAAGNTYNRATEEFESGTKTIEVVVGPHGVATIPVYLPTITSDDTYDIRVKAGVGTLLADSFPKEDKTVTFKEYITKTLTFDTRHSTAGYTIAAALDTTFSGTAGLMPEEDTGRAKNDLIDTTERVSAISLTGAVSKSSALLYVTRASSWVEGTGGDIASSNLVSATIIAMNSATKEVKVDDDTNILDGMTIYGDNIDEHITVSKDGSNILTLTVWPKNFKYNQIVYLSMGGWRFNFSSLSITGSGTTSLTATVVGSILAYGYADQTIQWQLERNVTTTPNASDQTATCTAGATVAVNCGTGDTDANASSKTYSRVAGPSKGSVGNNSTAFNNNTFTGSSITYNNTSGSAGATDTFTFKCNDGATDSATKTVTITLT